MCGTAASKYISVCIRPSPDRYACHTLLGANESVEFPCAHTQLTLATTAKPADATEQQKSEL